jgi:hypothetical protein
MMPLIPDRVPATRIDFCPGENLSAKPATKGRAGSSPAMGTWNGPIRKGPETSIVFVVLPA